MSRYEVTISLRRDDQLVITDTLEFTLDDDKLIAFPLSKAFEDLSQLQYEIAYDDYRRRFDE